MDVREEEGEDNRKSQEAPATEPSQSDAPPQKRCRLENA